MTAEVEVGVEGTMPPFDQGTVGINIMPLGSVEVRWRLGGETLPGMFVFAQLHMRGVAKPIPRAQAT